MTRANQMWRLAARPVGAATAETWAWREEPVADSPGLGDGEFLVENEYLSLDPAMRGWLGEAKSYIPPVAVGDVMRAVGAGRVIESRHPQFPVGAHVTGLFGVQRFAISNGRGAQMIDPAIAPLPVWLGALGLPGLTAWFGLTDVGKMREGDTVVVSGAAGAVGSVAGQIATGRAVARSASRAGPRSARGCASSATRRRSTTSRPGGPKHALREHAPKGIDVYFDNVGGDTLDAALAQLARGARVVVCGAISPVQRRRPDARPGQLPVAPGQPREHDRLRRARLRRALRRRAARARRVVRGGKTGDARDGDRRPRSVPRAYDALFAGENLGKLVATDSVAALVIVTSRPAVAGQLRRPSLGSGKSENSGIVTTLWAVWTAPPAPRAD